MPLLAKRAALVSPPHTGIESAEDAPVITPAAFRTNRLTEKPAPQPPTAINPAEAARTTTPAACRTNRPPETRAPQPHSRKGEPRKKADRREKAACHPERDQRLRHGGVTPEPAALRHRDRKVR